VLGTHYPCARVSFLETHENGSSRSTGAIVNDVIIILNLHYACNSTGYQHGPFTGVENDTCVHGPCVPAFSATRPSLEADVSQLLLHLFPALAELCTVVSSSKGVRLPTILGYLKLGDGDILKVTVA